MNPSTGHVMTLANSIIGVSVLAMPYCFKQCGIILSVIMLVLSNVMTRLCCHFLVKSATIARRRNYEFLAFHTFGPTGKLVVELSIIGFLLGTCIAFFVVMGDLGPDILAKAFGLESFSHLRPSILIVLALLVVLPLGLLRNVDSLSSVCTASILFYLCLVLKVMSEATPHLLAADWLEHVRLWRPSGILQCIPIFSMALACQTQVFEIYESLPEASLSRMNDVVRSAVNMCTGVYICVGFFGYVAFCTQNFTGNVLMSFSPSMVTDIIKVGFVLSVAVSFPLVIFPCRASLYSLLFRRVSTWHPELASGPVHIPEGRFKCLTVVLVVVSLIVGLLLPNIELVLGLVGSTIGTVICLLLPALMFTRLASKYSSERLLAQVIFFVAAFILVLSTYANLHAADHASSPGDLAGAAISLRPPPPELKLPPKMDFIRNNEPQVIVGKGVIGGASNEMKKLKKAIEEVQKKKKEAASQPKQEIPPLPELMKKVEKLIPKIEETARQEPLLPVPPADSRGEKTVNSEDLKEKVPVKSPEEPKLEAPKVEVPKVVDSAPAVPVKPKDPPAAAVETPVKPAEEVAPDAIRKDEEERAAEEGPAKKSSPEAPAAPPGGEQQEKLLAKLAEHEQAQEKLLLEQKQILQELKEQQAIDTKDKEIKPGGVEVKPAAPVEVVITPQKVEIAPPKEQKKVQIADSAQQQQPQQEVKPDPVAVDGSPDKAAVQDIGEIVSGLQKLTKELKDVMKQQQLPAQPAVAAEAAGPASPKLGETKAQPVGAMLTSSKKILQQKSQNAANAAEDKMPVAPVELKPAQPEEVKSNQEGEKHLRDKREVESGQNVSCSQDEGKVASESIVDQTIKETPENKKSEDTVALGVNPVNRIQEAIPVNISQEPVNKAQEAGAVNKTDQVSPEQTRPGSVEVKTLTHLSVPEVKMDSPAMEVDAPLQGDALGKPMSRDLRSLDPDKEEE